MRLEDHALCKRAVDEITGGRAALRGALVRTGGGESVRDQLAANATAAAAADRSIAPSIIFSSISERDRNTFSAHARSVLAGLEAAHRTNLGK